MYPAVGFMILPSYPLLRTSNPSKRVEEGECTRDNPFYQEEDDVNTNKSTIIYGQKLRTLPNVKTI